MFNEKKELIRKLQNENDDLNRLVDYYQKSWCPKAPEINLSNDFVECEKCGCLLNKKTAYRGEPIKVIKPTNPMANLGDAISNLINASKGIDTGDKNQYELKEVYYCKIHKPNKK